MTTNETKSELLAAGATLERKETTAGETKTGWWMDGVYLGKDPHTALESLRG